MLYNTSFGTRCSIGTVYIYDKLLQLLAVIKLSNLKWMRALWKVIFDTSSLLSGDLHQ